ncbi:MAG: hypothetical protein LBL93_07095 [Ruminococcus sp.]|nr:hypothetical protein [Ruminococcus sp.]
MQGATTAIYNCIEVIIPSMYGLMIISEIFIRSNLYKIFPGNSGLFLVSLIAGYPVAIKLLADLKTNNIITKNKFVKMSLYCYAGSPTYIAGCVSWHLYENKSLTLIIFLSVLLSNITILFFTLFFREPKTYTIQNSKLKDKKRTSVISKLRSIHFNSNIIVESVLSSAKALLKICAMLIACAIFWQLIGNNNYIVAGLYDVSNIIYFPKQNYNLLPLITALVSFGGLCVILQLIALTNGKINLLIFVPVRIAGALLAFLYCKLLSPFLLDENLLTIAKSVHLFEGNTAFTSVILLLMTFMLLCITSLGNKKIKN